MASGMRIQVDAEATSGKNLYVFPPLQRSGDAQGLRAVADALAAEQGGGPGSELQEISFPEGLTSAGKLVGNIEVEVPVTPLLVSRPDVAPGSVGLYGLEAGKWNWLANANQDGTVKARLASLSPLMVAADPLAPRITVVSHENGSSLETQDPEVVWAVAEEGSGVDEASIQVLVDEAVVPHTYDSTLRQVRLALARPLPPGTHRFELALQDNSGNSTRSTTLYLTAPDGFGFSDPPLAVPNPARIQSAIRFDLTQPAATERVTCEIFDASGRRVMVLEQSNGFLARGNTLRWDLRNRRGGKVRNGVYLFRVRARGAGNTVTAQGKIAVLR
jgi:hypothetical protein